MFQPWGRHLVYNLIVSLTFQLFSLVFLMCFGLPHPLIVNIFWYVCTYCIDFMGVHLLHCTHGNECIGTYDGVCNTFATIAWDVGFHMGWEQVHALPSTMFNSSCCWINIVLTKDEIHTLIKIIIVDPTWMDLFFWSCAT